MYIVHSQYLLAVHNNFCTFIAPILGMHVREDVRPVDLYSFGIREDVRPVDLYSFGV